MKQGLVLNLLRKLSHEQMVQLEQNHDLFDALADHPDLSRVDRGKFYHALNTLPRLLERVAIVDLPALPAFVLAGHFRIGRKNPAGVTIGRLGDRFQTNFNSITDVALPAATIRIDRLKKGATGNSIVSEIGHDGIIETTLAQLWELLTYQPNGESGHLLNNGYPNLFYIQDGMGSRWVVDCRWRASQPRGWCLDFVRPTPTDWWYVGLRVFSQVTADC